MEDENPTPFRPPMESDLDLSFTSTTSSATTFASSSTSSARSSLSLLPFDTRLSSSSSPLQPLPHHRADPHWSAVRAAAALSPDGSLHLRNLKVLRQLGSGNLARVFQCRFRDDDASPDFALKVVDTYALARAKNAEERLSHVRTEARVLAALDHPFLPTLYARLEAPRYTCFLIDYCPGGDLHSLLRRRPGNRLPLEVVRFFAAEVLLALEYLHASGFVYRDLKPENVLRRGDGHVMLSDFDLCLLADVVPALRRRPRSTRSPAGPTGGNGEKSKRQNRYGFCFGAGAHRGEHHDKTEEPETVFVAEPVTAFSRECVGTHEYLAPEVVSGEGHGSGVDWWAFGVFVYELLYGRTPFKGGSKESTLRNIKSGPLRFPEGEVGSAADGGDAAAARDLIDRLLVRDPRRRLGGVSGATDVKRHRFFEGIDWPLIRCYKPPGFGGVEGKIDVRSLRIRERRRRWWWYWPGLRRTCNNNKNNNNSVIRSKGAVINLGLRSEKKTKKAMNGWFD